MKDFKKFIHACLRAGWEIYQDQYSYRASALAFTTLLAIVPMITISIYILTHFYLFYEIKDTVNEYVIQNFIPYASREILMYLIQFTTQAAKLPVWSLIFLFVTTLLLIASIDDTMNLIWENKYKNINIFLYFVYALVVFILPFLIMLSALVSSLLNYLILYISGYAFFAIIISLFLNATILAILYYLTSKANTDSFSLIMGSLIAALLLEIAKITFAIYIKYFTSYELIYGTLAIIPVLLIWLFIFWLIILYGALLIKNLLKQKLELK